MVKNEFEKGNASDTALEARIDAMKELKEKKVLRLTICGNKAVHNYVMNDLVWKIDLPNFLKEISMCSKYVPYTVSFQILAQVLGILAKRAIEINDPALNIIMLNLGLYEGAHDENINDVIYELRQKIKSLK